MVISINLVKMICDAYDRGFREGSLEKFPINPEKENVLQIAWKYGYDQGKEYAIDLSQNYKFKI